MSLCLNLLYFRLVNYSAERHVAYSFFRNCLYGVDAVSVAMVNQPKIRVLKNRIPLYFGLVRTETMIERNNISTSKLNLIETSL